VNEATSARAALLLKERGVQDVRALAGGWNDWVNDGNPTEK
jgi:3-mercaptopyruvate sulfurtransferase SseA